jgi:hypothetical protein
VDLSFEKPELARWDQAGADLLICGVFSDERPLRGAAGLLDWRTSGMLSRLLRENRLLGQDGEVLLLPGTPRLGVAKVLVFGLGTRQDFDEKVYARVAQRLFQVASGLGAERILIAPPGRAGYPLAGGLGARRALELLMEGYSQASREKRFRPPQAVILVEDPQAQKEMAEAWRERRRPLA